MSSIAKVSCDCCGKNEELATQESASRGWPNGWISMELQLTIDERRNDQSEVRTEAKVSGIHVCPSCRPLLATLLTRSDDNTLELIRTGKAKHS